jgi:hypothetical protein
MDAAPVATNASPAGTMKNGPDGPFSKNGPEGPFSWLPAQAQA